MEVYPLNSIEGAYWYLIAVVVVASVAMAAYFGAAAAGLVPDPAALFP